MIRARMVLHTLVGLSWVACSSNDAEVPQDTASRSVAESPGSGAPAPRSANGAAPETSPPEAASERPATARELTESNAPPEGETAAVRFSLGTACALPEAENGWGPVEQNLSNGEDAAGDGGPLSIDDVVYESGLGMHAPARVVYDLAAGCQAFHSIVGVDDEMKSAGSVRFEVWGDGVLLAQSPELTGADPGYAMDIDVNGVGRLELRVDALEGNGSDHADWANASVTCGTTLPACPTPEQQVPSYDGYQLVWSDEFSGAGAPNPDNWSFESGLVRNEEEQWYQADNAQTKAGFLIIEGREEGVANPSYQPGSGDWRNSRQQSRYTSSSLHSRGKQSFLFGRMEMRGRFPAYAGLWPAWWTLGVNGEWPSNGEIDILEFYGGGLHANFVVGTQRRWEGNWDAVTTSLASLGDADWDARFHVYRMDWDEERISLYVDGRLLNDMRISELRNPDGESPFLQPHYLLLNLAIGGQAAGDASRVPFPVRYEVDYVRVYQRVE